MVDISALRQTINEESSRFAAFHDVFWKFIKTEVGITHIYQEKQSYLKKKVSFEERRKKIDLLLQRADFDDDKLNPSDEELVKWSGEALELSQIIKKLGLNKDICSEEYLYKFFETFYAQKNSIKTLDESLMRFENLQILNLTNNKIERLQNLPPNLRELNLTGNLVAEVEPLRTPLGSLIHLGLAYNAIRTPALVNITKNFPNLFCLDLAFNELTDFRSACQWLERLEGIKMLYLCGNPCQLTPDYRDILKQRFQSLRILDGSQAFTEVEENAKKKHRKRVMARLAHLGDVPESAFKIPAQDLIPIQDNVSFELELRLLDNITGTYINDGNCQQMESLNLDEIPVERKSALYWLRFENHRGETVETEKRAWIDHFQVDAEKGTGRCDFKYTLRIDEAPSTELRDWLESELFVELLCSQPKFSLKLSEDSGEQVRDIILDSEGLPEIQQKTLGVLRFSTSQLIKKPQLTAEDTNYHKLNRFYALDLMERPEFKFKNHLIELKEADMEMLQQALEAEEAEESKRNLLASQDGANSHINIKKPDPKAKDAKGKAPAKGSAGEENKNAPKAIEIEYPDEIAAEPDFILMEKSFQQAKQTPETAASLKKHTKSSVTITSGQAPPGTANSDTKSLAGQSVAQSAAQGTMEQKKMQRLAELKQVYNLVRALPFTIAVAMKLNYVPPPVDESVKPETPAESVAPKGGKDSKASKAKGKK